VRLKFGAINDNAFIFPNDEWFGLGLFRHQDFVTGKTASTWEHSSTCYDYSELDAEMFRSTNVKTAGNTFIAALVFSVLTLVSVLVMKYWQIQSKAMWMGTAFVSFISAILQVVAFTKMMDSSGRSVCSIDRYAADIDGMWSWYVDYPSAIFPYVAYARFFQSCEIGSTGKAAIAGMFLQFVVSVLYVLHYFVANCGNKKRKFSIPIVSEVPNGVNAASQKDIDEEAQDHTIEGSYENNQLGPLAHSAPKVVPEDNFNDDNISYVNGIEDEIRAEDDLSMDANYEPPFAQQEDVTTEKEVKNVRSSFVPNQAPVVKASQAPYLPPAPVKMVENNMVTEAANKPSTVSSKPAESSKATSSPARTVVKTAENKAMTEAAHAPSAVSSTTAEPSKATSSPARTVVETAENKAMTEAANTPSAVSSEPEPSKATSSPARTVVKTAENKTMTEAANTPSAVSSEPEPSKATSSPARTVVKTAENKTMAEAANTPSSVSSTTAELSKATSSPAQTVVKTAENKTMTEAANKPSTVSSKTAEPSKITSSPSQTVVKGIVKTIETKTMEAANKPSAVSSKASEPSKATFFPSPAAVKTTEKEMETEATSDPKIVSTDVETANGSSSSSPDAVDITENEMETEATNDPSVESTEVESAKDDSSSSPDAMEMTEEEETEPLDMSSETGSSKVQRSKNKRSKGKRSKGKSSRRKH
jgi:hypothetical protein